MFEMIPWRKNNNSLESRGDGFEQLMSSFFNDDFLGGFAGFGKSFSVDLKENEKEYLIKADLPGVNKDQIDIDYNNGYLTIAAKREDTKEENKDNYVRKERSYGEFRRCFYINNIEEDKIEASFNNGVLEMKLPKLSEGKKNRGRIQIN